MKKLIVCLAILVISSSALADNPPLLIGSWENQTNEGWMDHQLNSDRSWAEAYIDDPEILGTRYWFSTDFQTDGSYSVKVVADPQTEENGYGQRLKIDVHNDLWDHSKLEFDIYGMTDSWIQIEEMIYTCETTGWYEISGYPWAVGNLEIKHIVIDYMELGTGAQASPTDAYGSFVFCLNSGSTGSFLYVDNVQLTGPVLIPEPATIGLLGLGGLALLRRKR